MQQLNAYAHIITRQVSTNGVISFGAVFSFLGPTPFSNASSHPASASFVAAPYWADIDTTFNGEIWYETHTAEGNSTESDLLLERVSRFIRERQNEPTFSGTWMLVAMWNESFPFSFRFDPNVTEVNTCLM